MQTALHKITIFVIDDHPLVRDGIATMLNDIGYLQIAGFAKTAKEALDFLSASTPHIILLDINLPDMDGLQLCDRIREFNTTSKILGLTSTNESGIISSLLQRGGNGYLLKNMERNELVTAIDTIMDGKIYLSKAANEKLLEQFLHNSAANKNLPITTRREKEILQLLANGLNGPKIAEKLFLSAFTVETHRKNLMKKLNVSSTQMLLKTAREHHII